MSINENKYEMEEAPIDKICKLTNTIDDSEYSLQDQVIYLRNEVKQLRDTKQDLLNKCYNQNLIIKDLEELIYKLKNPDKNIDENENEKNWDKLAKDSGKIILGKIGAKINYNKLFTDLKEKENEKIILV